MTFKNLLVAFCFVLMLLAAAYLAASPDNRKGPENGLIQFEYHIWKDTPLQRQDVIDAEQRLQRDIDNVTRKATGKSKE